jgi:hypothetical protein
MTGDLNLTAIGTCTEVTQGRVFGFGHAMNNEGAVTLPMGSGRINGIIPNMMTSFKIGEMTQVRGALGADETVGVAGRLGTNAPTVPVDLHLVYTDGTVDRRFHFDAALHPKLTPMLAAVAVSASLTGGRELPQYNTLEYDLNLEFDGGQKVALKDTLVNTSAQEIFFVIGMPLIAASENPFERVPVKRVTGDADGEHGGAVGAAAVREPAEGEVQAGREPEGVHHVPAVSSGGGGDAGGDGVAEGSAGGDIPVADQRVGDVFGRRASDPAVPVYGRDAAGDV